MSRKKKCCSIQNDTQNKTLTEQKVVPTNANKESQKAQKIITQGKLPNNAKISWRFMNMDNGGLGECSLKLLHDYQKKMLSYEKLTKEEIESKDHCHPCPVKKLTSEAKKRVDIKKIGYDTLYQIYLGNLCRLWGFWDKNVFNVVWLDKKHEFYKCK